LEYIKLAYREVKKKKLLVVFFVYLFGISILGHLEEFDQLYYQFVDLPIWAFGIMGAIWMGTNALGSYFAHRFKGKVYLYYLFPLLASIAIFFVGFFPGRSYKYASVVPDNIVPLILQSKSPNANI